LRLVTVGKIVSNYLKPRPLTPYFSLGNFALLYHPVKILKLSDILVVMQWIHRVFTKEWCGFKN